LSSVSSVLSSPPSTRKFLVVDDEADLLAAADLVLKAWGHKTECFTDPIKALEAFRAAPNDYAVALLDIRMPRMTGTELAKELVKIRRNLPIVFMSAFELSLPCSRTCPWFTSNRMW
jgi:CheY-like chemotaxis protein